MNKKTENKKIVEAAALKYTPENDAPRIVALGKGKTAEKIINIAKLNNVPLYKDEILAKTLNKFKPGDEIPEALYEIIAEILVFIGNLDMNYGEKNAAKK